MSLTTFFPEFDEHELAETVRPLDEYDPVLRALLLAGPPPAVGDLPAPVDAWVAAPEEYPFQRVVRRLASPVAAGFVAALPDGLVVDTDRVVADLLARAEARVRETATRTLVAAVNRAGSRGELRGTTPHARYLDFVERAWSPSLAPFPLLLPAVERVVAHTRAAVLEMLARLAHDRDAVARLAGLADDDVLTSIGAADGDAHGHGRSVAVLTFASGRRVVHKPRDVSCEAAYRDLAAGVGDLVGCELPAATVVPRDGYGWVEFVAVEDVADDLPGFLQACGRMAAVLYLLDARDMHFENIVATRRGPVPIDLETLLHPARVFAGPRPEAPDNAYDAVARSVYGLGVLPLVLPAKDGGPDHRGHVDLGFLGGDHDGVSPFKALVLDEPFTDRVRVRLESRPADRRTTVLRGGSEADVRRWADSMAQGFTEVCTAVRAQPARWQALLDDATRGLRVRYVHNPTALYVQTLRMTASAAAMADPDVALGALKRIAIASKLVPHGLVASELQQLVERDVPCFRVDADDTVVRDPDGRDTGARVTEPPRVRAAAKAGALGPNGVRRQVSLIHAAFSALFPDNHLGVAEDTGAAADDGASVPGAPVLVPDRGAALRALARSLADDLVAANLPDRFAHLPSTWVGPLASAQAARPWPVGVLGYDLYTGRTGPALALAAAARAWDDERLAAVPRQVFSTSAAILADGVYEPRSVEASGPGAYTGTTGLLVALVEAGRLLDEPGWVEAAQQAVPLVAAQVREDGPPDVIAGLAGTASLLAAVGGPHAAVTVDALVDRLLRCVAAPDGAWWQQSGHAHGIAGVLATLARLAPVTTAGPADGGPDVRSAAGVLLARLEEFFDPAEDDWCSRADGSRRFATGWCHGAAGIAAALAEAAAAWGDTAVAARRDTAVATTRRRGFGRNLTWCHGDLGNADVLRHVAELTADDGLRDHVDRVEQTVLSAEVLARKLADVGSRYAHTTSLMVGRSGVLLHLLRRLDPDLRTSPLRFPPAVAAVASRTGGCGVLAGAAR